MISPHTPPGTLVVCVDDKVKAFLVPIFAGPRCEKLDGLKRGRIYTVRKIIPDSIERGSFMVMLVEIDRCNVVTPGYDLRRFDIAVLPKCLADIRDAAPINQRETVGARG